MKARAASPILVVLGLALDAIACSSTWVTPPPPGPGESCASDPFSCATGETCWPVDSAEDVACIPAAAIGGGFLASCAALVGSATCAQGLACNVVPPTASGTCTFYCDPSHPCPTGYVCDVVRLGTAGTALSICRAG